MAFTVAEGIATAVAATSTLGGVGDPITVKAMVFLADSTVSVGSIFNVDANDGVPTTILRLRVPSHDTHVINFAPPRQFSNGIRISHSLLGAGAANDWQFTLVLA